MGSPNNQQHFNQALLNKTLVFSLLPQTLVSDCAKLLYGHRFTKVHVIIWIPCRGKEQFGRV